MAAQKHGNHADRLIPSGRDEHGGGGGSRRVAIVGRDNRTGEIWNKHHGRGSDDR